MQTTTVFIVDDHYMVIEGIRTLLQAEKDIELIGHASNAASCLSFLQSRQPDVILMDISMPEKSGVELCKEVREMYPTVFVIGLSTFNQFTFIDSMMEKGASGYLLKNADKEEIIEAIHIVAKGKTYLSDEAASTLKNAAHEESPVLTRRENEVLRLIADGLTNPEIAEKLFLSLSTVDTHRKSLMRKLNIKNTALLIRYAIEHKLI
jgi:DNA-binding NarL/FixJ family response regulator